MAEFWIGCGQITWGREMPYEQVLAEIAQAGYVGAPASPRSGASTAEIVGEIARHGLRPAPGYLGADFWDAAQEGAILARAKSLAAFAREAGMSELYVAAGGFGNYFNAQGQNRKQIAARVRPADAMTDAEFRQFAQTLNRVGEITLAQGVRSCFHNHVGSVIETRQEIDRLFALVDRQLIFQGPDIGHLAWAGVDPVQFCRDYAESIKTLHVKDINPQVLQEGLKAAWDYDSFSRHGIFAELGEGCVDLPAVFEVLRGAGFKGWVIVETDVTQKPTALQSATISRNYLRSIGL
jgi:inosose dehydratase